MSEEIKTVELEEEEIPVEEQFNDESENSEESDQSPEEEEEPILIYEDPSVAGENSVSMNSNRDEVQELLGHPPSWMLRYGITLLFIIVFGLLLLATIVKYPDVIEAEVVLTSNNPPITLYSKTTGKIDQLFVQDQEEVKKGDLLMIIESDATYDDMKKAENYIYQLNDIGNDYNRLLRMEPMDGLNLGNVKNSFSSLLATLSALQFFLKDNAVYQKVGLYKGEIKYNGELNESIQSQLEIYEKELVLEKSNFDRNKSLEEEGLISKEDFEIIEKQYIQSTRSLEQLKMSVINNKISTDRLKSNIVSLQANRKTKLQNYNMQLKEKLSIVEKEIKQWKASYLFYSTHDGNVSLMDFRTNNEFVNQLDPVLTIVPKNLNQPKEKKIIARANVSQFASGRINEGDKVTIRLESFPSKEFGVIHSEIETISLLPSLDEKGKRFYSMDIPLGLPIVTSYDTTIPFRPNQSGLAKIITKDRSVAGRIFEQFIDLIKNS